jgi:ergothioneine biosynthesis protein EgtB
VNARSYEAIRRATVDLCAPLSPEDCQVQSMPDASPAKWHLAHTTWFFETFVLERWQKPFRPFHPEFRVLYNSYYQTVGDQYPRAQRGLVSRPTVQEVHDYRAHVDAGVVRLLEAGCQADMARVVELGLHHEQQHQELILTDVKHMLSLNPLRPAYAGVQTSTAAAARPLRWCAFGGGTYHVGHDGPDFAFDNESPRHRQIVEPFELADRLVVNSEYREFVGDGGYQRPDLWLSDGWATVVAEGWKAPLYWCEDGGGSASFTLGGVQPLRDDEPICHLSYYETDAYARWAGARLPSEAEWEVSSAGVGIDGNFVESRRFHPCAAPGSDGLSQLFGDVWEWTSSAYSPYPGYRPPPGALGEYNGKFMCNQMVLRGGSCATPRRHIRRTYRNFFPPQARWQFSGIRLARSLAPA